MRRLTTEEMPGGGKKLVGTADNAFNRERAAVKAHAAATSGQYHPKDQEAILGCCFGQRKACNRE